MRKARWFLCATIVALLFINSSVFAQGKQVTLKVFTSVGILEDAMRLSMAEYQKLHPEVKFELSIGPDPGFYQKFLQEFSAGSVEWDIVEIYTSLEAVAIPANWVIPLDTYINKANLDVGKIFLHSYIDNGTLAGYAKKLNPAGTIYGFPVEGDVFQFVYRKDLYKQYGLTVANTWDEFINNSKKLNKPENDFYALAISGSTKADTHMMWDYYSIAFNTGGTYPIKPGTKEPDAYSPGNVKALQLYSDFINKYKFTPPGVREYSFSEKNIAISQGRAAQMFQWMYGSTRTNEDPTRSKVVGKLGYAWPPGGVCPTGGWVDCITQNSKNAQAAFDFIKFHSIDMDAKKLSTYGAGGVTKAIVNDQKVMTKFPFTPDFVKVSEAGKQIEMSAPYLPTWAEINAAMCRAIGSSLFEGVSPDSSLKKAQEEIGAILKQ
jgi:ABC-type glycerol-3-phosphate transport system substrate-binding protein